MIRNQTIDIKDGHVGKPDIVITALRATMIAQTDASAIVVDLARVNTIDAGGLAVLLELREQLSQKELSSD